MAKNNAAEQAQDGVEFEDGEAFTWNMKETEEDSGFAPIPAGTYLITVSSFEYKLSKSSGSPMWSAVYDVAEGEFAEKNRKIFDIISLKDGQQGRVKKFLNRAAPELAELTNLNPKKVAEDGVMLGRQFKVKVAIEKGTEEYPGDKNRVKDYFSASAGGSTGGSFQM